MQLQSLTLAALLLIPAALGAAEPRLVVDLNPGLQAFDRASLPASFSRYTAVNGRVVFLARTGHGSRAGDFQCGLWVTDGAAGGTERLADFCAEADEPPDSRHRMLASTGAAAFLTDYYGRLWVTDGTAAGTHSLGDLFAPGGVAVGPDGRTLFFDGCTTESGCELWRSDGTREGTVMVRDLAPGSGDSHPGGFLVHGGRLLFLTATAQLIRGSLWSTDGTAAGTVKLSTPEGYIADVLPHGGAVYIDVATGDRDEVWVLPAGSAKLVRLVSFFRSGFQFHLNLYEAGSRVVLVQSDHDGPIALWATDGTRAGTGPVGSRFRYLSDFGVLGSRTFFWGYPGTGRGQRTGLWFFDAGVRRPRRLAGCPQGCPELGYHDPTRFVPFQGRLFFAGSDPAHGFELWQTDGTAAGTRQVKDLCPGPCDGAPIGLRVDHGRLLFADSGFNLWASDGTAAGTVRIAALPPDTIYDFPFDLAELGDRIVFTGIDESNGPQPWVSDLTPGGSQPIRRVGDSLAAGGRIAALTALGGGAVFSGCDESDGAVWGSDGTAAGTALLGVRTPCGSLAKVSFAKVGSLAFFVLGDGLHDRAGLWRTDGSDPGTRQLLDLAANEVSGLAAVRGKLLFRLTPLPPSSPLDFWDLWTSDGTAQGTQPAFRLPLLGEPRFTPAGDDLLFVATDAAPPSASHLWITDGTEAGTRRLAPVDALDPAPAIRLGDRTFFLASTRDRRISGELWSTDGTSAGTAPVIADANAPHPEFPHSLVAFQGALYFFANSSDQRSLGLWRSDGTAAGTRLLFEPPMPFTLSSVLAFLYPQLTVAGDHLFFRWDDFVHGTELWRSDGTAAGSALVADVAPGRAHSRLAGLTAAGGKLYFAATDGEHGVELWESDGTAAGTRMVADVWPGPASSGPEQMTAAGGKLFFTADDGDHGRELWVLPLP